MEDLRIAISMRVTSASGYNEIRDTIARDWSIYLNKVFPKANWLLVPNMGEAVVDYLQKWNINALILTGGDDLGVFVDRDETEKYMFRYAQKQEYPVLGICRGLQAIYTWLGGKVESTDLDFAARHVAKAHDIIYEDKVYLVNSYHNLMLDPFSCPNELEPIAHSVNDNAIEAIRGHRILGFMWHPERYDEPKKWETDVIHEFLNQ
ncbi:gamma-glutamyl-gamma-aminobutyrate hydrolase family protein [Phaeodactylibacter xiamenensis]|uniref:gamma-glutamyl-gamma-aminobutyrate hydrolase family protein n=1 Tax=Phaeodactylibacter xiamenensis TaxID=1524460 RepID=UPI0024A89A4A|nr:gamma-glutamyl-gamma-aminobutyrate hydrolase family protein [Phaeodactylibacter xiamenensis]